MLFLVEFLHLALFSVAASNTCLYLESHTEEKAGNRQNNRDESAVPIVGPQKISGETSEDHREDLKYSYHQLSRLACHILKTFAPEKGSNRRE